MRVAVFLIAGLMSSVAQAGELELSLYGGFNTNHPSQLTLSNGTISQTDFITWEGRSFTSAPPYYGLRAIYWPDSFDHFGIGLDFTHMKAYADIAGSGVADTYEVLEFSDGLNQLNATAFGKWDYNHRLRGYTGIGAGLAIPHVEVTTLPGSITGESTTFEYQAAGATVSLIAGLSYAVYGKWRVSGEYKFTYSTVEGQLTGGVGTVSTGIISHHVALGIARSFDVGGF